MGWYFHLVKCYQFRCDQVENSVLISQACVHISQVEQLWKFQLSTPMTVRESPSQSAPTRIINPGSAAGSARLAWWGSCKNTWNPQLSVECWGCFPRVYWICRSKLIILQLGVVIEHCENKGFCCADTFCVLKYKHDLFPCAWKLIDHALEECPGVKSSDSPSFSCATLGKASFHRPAAAFYLYGIFLQNEELLTLSRSLQE